MTHPVRPLTADEESAFRLARLAAVEGMPYLAQALFAMTPMASPGLGTFGVDRAWRLYMDPALLVGPGAWPVPVTAAILLHEVGHLLRDHCGRAAALPAPRDDLAWNYAGDAEINDDLLAAAVPLPSGAVTPEALGQPPHGLAEDYYAALTRRPSPLGQGDDASGGGCGSGAGCDPLPGELDVDTDPGITAAEGDLVRRQVAQAVRDRSEGSGRGTVPAGLERWASTVLAPPTVPWQQVLRAAVRRAVANRVGRLNYTYSRPPRRPVPGVVTPAMRGPAAVVSIVVDTSGSMSSDHLDAALSEVAGVLRAAGVDRERVHVLACDADTTTPRRVRSVADVPLQGGGGTDMRVGIAAAEKGHPQPQVVIVLTDGLTPWPDRPTRALLVCAVISPDSPSGTPSWARTVHVPIGASR